MWFWFPVQFVSSFSVRSTALHIHNPAHTPTSINHTLHRNPEKGHRIDNRLGDSLTTKRLARRCAEPEVHRQQLPRRKIKSRCLGMAPDYGRCIPLESIRRRWSPIVCACVLLCVCPCDCSHLIRRVEKNKTHKELKPTSRNQLTVTT